LEVIMGASARILAPRTGSPPAEAKPQKAPPRGKTKKEITYRGICITCGEKIVIASDKMEIAYFAFCNAECKARFDAEMNEEID
jgi:hypothetical protein